MTIEIDSAWEHEGIKNLYYVVTLAKAEHHDSPYEWVESVVYRNAAGDVFVRSVARFLKRFRPAVVKEQS